MKRATVRRKLVSEFTEPSETIKFEIWPNGHCLMYVSGEEGYNAFPSIDSAIEFLTMNFD